MNYLIIDTGKTKLKSFYKNEKELRQWAEEIRQNEGLQEVVSEFVGNDNGKYWYEIDLCIEFLESYDWEIIKQTPIIENNCWKCNESITYTDEYYYCPICSAHQ